MKQILEILNIPTLMELDRFSGFVHGQRSQQPLAEGKPRERKIVIESQTLTIGMNSGYTVAPGGIALVNVVGPMFKGYGAYGYADQSALRADIRNAANDPNVSGIMLLIDSPGGSVAGTSDLAAEIKAADAIKPVFAYIEDMGASAAYWTAASARQVYSNGGMVGSIGVVTAIADSSKLYEAAGVKIIPIVTGSMKAVGMEGTPVTPEQVAYVQSMIDVIFNSFVDAVSKGRGVRGETVRKMEAKVFVGEQAVENKLIDGVMSFDKAFALLGKTVKNTGSTRRAKAALEMEMCNDW